MFGPEKNQINLIESILLGYPIPEFLFLEKEDANVVIDGQQRIGAIMDFISGDLRLEEKHLSKSDILNRISNQNFEELDNELRRSFFRVSNFCSHN